MPPEELKYYTIWEYLQELKAEVDRILSLSDSEARKELADNGWSETPEQWRTNAREAFETANYLYNADRVMDASQYPRFNDFYQRWVYNNSNLVLGGKAYRSPDGRLWDIKQYQGGDYTLSEYDQPTAMKMLSEYWAEESKDMSTGEKARLAEDIRQFNESMAWNQQKYLQEQASSSQQAASDRAYQQQQLALQQQQYQWQRGLQERQWGLQQEELAQRRQETLAELKSQPKSWIQAWLFEHGKPQSNQPFDSRPDVTSANNAINLFAEAASRNKAEWDTARQLAEQGLENNPYGVPSQDWANIKANNYVTQTGQLSKLITEAQATQANYDEGRYVPMAQNPQNTVRQSLPNAPEWLPQLVPGLQAGQPITQQRARVASGQQWQTLSPSKREMLGGYLEWASPYGAPTLSDYEYMVQSMLPKQTASTNWRPALQR